MAELADLLIRAIEQHRDQLNAQAAPFVGQVSFHVDLDCNVTMRRIDIGGPWVPHQRARILAPASTHEAGDQDLQGGTHLRSAALLLPPDLREAPNTPPDLPRHSANLFERLGYLVKAVLFLVQEGLNTRHTLENLMATQEELQAALDRNTTATTAAGAAITTELEQLRQALSKLSTATPPTQANLDQLNASTTTLEAATAALTADDAPATPPTA